MKILHISDTHGALRTLLDRDTIDAVVHSGDFLPNCRPSMPVLEAQWQLDWIARNADRLKQWLGGTPFLLCPGNHDFVDPCEALRAIGVNASSLCDQVQTLNGVTFHGFPWVPALGYWWHEAVDQELERRTDDMDLDGVDVLVAHCPPRGVLDKARDNVRIGNKYLRDRFEHDRPESVRLILTGHCHEQGGGVAMPWSGVTVVNSACTRRLLTI